jgi:predicted CxxxxCH...CXXCH cytochrome family protein
MRNIMKIHTKYCSHITTGIALLSGLLLFTGALLLPHEASAAAISCSSGVSGCHFTPTVKDGTARNVPSGRFLGSHARHSGYSTGSKRQYQFACTACHPSASYTNAHQSGYKNITGSSLPGNRYSAGKRIANTNTPAFGNCSNIYCHSNGRATGMGQLQYSSSRWGGSETCLGCHAGRNGATGSPSRSVGNFTLSTTHSQHLKYPAANINCQICHSKTATDAATLKNFTGVQHHINGVRDVTFTNIAYASYTSYKSTEAGSSANTRVCTNTSCHGGKTRSSWSATAQNTDHQCAHCHGTPGTSAATQVTGANRYNLRFFAPGYKKTGTVGTSTDQNVVSNDIRVGSHFKHLSSAYMRNIKCNECHKVPSTPFSADTNHTLNTLRYNSATLDFSQASSARILIGVASGSTPAQLAAFAGYTNGTGVKAATCSSVYCHGNRLKNGAAGGSYTKPYWNYSAMINYTDKTNACGRCHGNPPSSVSSQHSGKTPTTSCSSCHGSVVNSSGVIINKALHINGQVEATSGHSFPYPGATHSLIAGATNPSANCSCHDYTNAGTYPVAAGTAPACKACHTVGLLRTAASSSCYDCHGAGPADGKPNAGTTFPNWSGSHTTHVTGQGMACSDCHANGGTGSANHGNSNRTAKTRTTVNVQNGGTATFTYAAATQTCSSVSCHGTAVWSVTQFDCVSCHGASLNGRRQITGTGGDFAKNSHHVTSGTLTKWHCIICHAEGNTSTGGTTTLHKNGSVELRNVDAPGNPGTAGTNYWSIPDTKAAADYTNIDNFCFKCHDAVGSASVAYNGTAVITTGLTATQQQKPFNDNLTNAYDGIARTRVVDVDTQFTATNYSHHAVKAAKYSAAGGLPFNSITILEGGTVDDNSRLHCHDCHYLNGHGTANEYLLQNSSGADTLHGISSYVCLKCHTATYSTTTHTGGNGSDFVNTAGAVGVTARAGGKTDGNITGISCTNCHNVGGTGWGGIHGGNNTYTQGGGGSQSTYRFMPGMNNNGYTVTNWTAASSAISCYTNPTTNWGVCTSHTGGKGATVTRVGGARALSY